MIAGLDPGARREIFADELLRKIAADLEKAFPAYAVRIAEDPDEALGLLCEDASGGRIIVSWEGDEPFPSAPRAGEIAGARIALTVTRSKSLSPAPGSTLIGESGERSFLRAVGEIRARLLAYEGSSDSTDRRFRYKGIELVILPDGIPIAAFRIRADLWVAIPRLQAVRLDL